MLEKLQQFWRKYGLELLVGLALLFLIIMGFIRKGKKGSWNVGYVRPPVSSVRRPPSESKGEVECRRVLEHIFGKPFAKIRPEFLRNPVTSDNGYDNNLELDCYNATLKLAVEYNGVQHYKYVPYFHKTRDAFQNQKYRDHMKRDLCAKNGITLIEVPYTVKTPDIARFLTEKLSSSGYIKDG